MKETFNLTYLGLFPLGKSPSGKGMGIKMKCVDIGPEHVDAAVSLAMAEYEKESQSCLALQKWEPKEKIESLAASLFKAGYGMAVMEKREMLGYLAFLEPVERLHGTARGIFSPLGGSAFAGKDRERLASLLFEAVSRKLVVEGITSIAVSRPAHDVETLKSFVLNGFGIRCSDGIMDLGKRRISVEPDGGAEICELCRKEKRKVLPLVEDLSLHLSRAPVFLPVKVSLAENMEELEKQRVFAAKVNEKVIGCMCIKENAETFVAESDKMANIGIAYVEERYRGRNVAQQLLEFVCRTIEKEGRTFLGVDCETLNPAALRFWGKYFTPYTYSGARRIDERILEKGGI